MPEFEGTLEEFWEAAKALGTKAILIEAMKMEEADFEREFEHNTDESEVENINLLDLSPELREYATHVGKDCTFILVAKGGVADIEFTLTEPWWDEFQEKAAAAYGAWADGLNEKSEADANAQREADEKALKSLRGLISDSEFCRLRTLRSMLEYATERFPELDGVDEFVIKPELQALKAKIEAKGLNRVRK